MLSKSERQTRQIAGSLVSKYKDLLAIKSLVFALEGDLGSGKTVFAKGVAQALGIKKVIRSPSFIIEREFAFNFSGIKGKFYHLDLWRMEDKTEIKKLKIEDQIKPGNLILIEWAEKTKDFLKRIQKEQKAKIIWVKFQIVDPITRNLSLKDQD